MIRKLWMSACWAFASSCASIPDSAVSPPPGGSDALSPAPVGMEPGFDEAEATATWRPGDAVVYGVTMRSPSASRQWLVKVEVHSHPGVAELADETPLDVMPGVVPPRDPAVAEPAPVLLRVEIFDAKGVSESVRHVLVPAAELEHGLYPGCQVGSPSTPLLGEFKVFGYSEEQTAVFKRSGNALLAYMRLGSPALKPILDTVVARPSLARILLHGGYVHLGISAHFPLAKEAGGELAIGVDPVDALPFQIAAYEQPALIGRLFVTESRPPFLPGAGIVGVEAWHPEDETTRVSARLLSARRGRLDRDLGAGGG